MKVAILEGGFVVLAFGLEIEMSLRDERLGINVLPQKSQK